MGPHWDTSAARSTPVEVLLEVPTDSRSPRPRQVTCEGKLVRTRGTDAAGTPVSIAVAVGDYSVVPASPGTEASPAREPVTTPATAAVRRAHVTAPREAADGGGVRRSSRAGLDMERMVIVEVNSDGRETPTSATGRIASLGPEGAFVELGEDYPIGCSLNICFKLPPLFSPISCSAIVRSRSPGRGIGVEFTDLVPADREQIQKLVDDH